MSCAGGWRRRSRRCCVRSSCWCPIRRRACCPSCTPRPATSSARRRPRASTCAPGCRPRWPRATTATRSTAVDGEPAPVDQLERVAEEIVGHGVGVEQPLLGQATRKAEQRRRHALGALAEGRRPQVLHARLERPRQRAIQLRAAGGVARPQPRVAGRLGPVLVVEEEDPALGTEQVREDAVGRRRHVTVGRRRLELRRRRADGLVDPIFNQGEEQVVLAREVPVHGALGVARPRRDLVHRRLAEPPLGEHLGGGREKGLAAVAALGAGGPRAAIETRAWHGWYGTDWTVSMPASQPILWQIAVSHYSEKARWALDYKGVEHQRRSPPPGLHMPVVLWLTRGRSY